MLLMLLILLITQTEKRITRKKVFHGGECYIMEIVFKEGVIILICQVEHFLTMTLMMMFTATFVIRRIITTIALIMLVLVVVIV